MKFTLSSLQASVQKHSVFIGLNVAFLLVLLILINMVWASFKTRSRVDEPTIGSFEPHAGPVQVLNTAEAPQVPETLNTYESQQEVSAQEQARIWAQQLNLQPHPQAPDALYLNATTSETLAHTPKTERIDYSHFELFDPDTATVTTESEAQAQLMQFLSTLGITLDDIEIESAEPLRYVQDTLENSFEPAEGEAPIAYRFELSQNVDGIPFASDASEHTFWSFLVTGKGVLQAQLQGTRLSVDGARRYTPKPFAEVLTAIQSGQFSIVGSLARFETQNTIQRLNLRSVRLEYRRDASSGLILPMWRFDGTATLKAGNTEDISIVTSALPTRPAQP